MSNHPLSDVGLHIKQFKCFGEEGAGFNPFRPINIVIGRNNSGKSALIDAVELCVAKGKSYEPDKHARRNTGFTVTVSQVLDEHSLRSVFHEHVGRGGVPGPNHWSFGQQFVGQDIQRSYGPMWKASFQSAPDFRAIQQPNREEYYAKLADAASWPFESLRLLKISAERDVQPVTLPPELPPL